MTKPHHVNIPETYWIYFIILYVPTYLLCGKQIAVSLWPLKDSRLKTKLEVLHKDLCGNWRTEKGIRILRELLHVITDQAWSFCVSKRHLTFTVAIELSRSLTNWVETKQTALTENNAVSHSIVDVLILVHLLRRIVTQPCIHMDWNLVNVQASTIKFQ